MKKYKTVYKKNRYLTEGAILGAVYAALTILLAPLSYGHIQLRVSEALTVLPYFTPAAIPGLFVGCLIANIYAGSLFDIIFGSLASLIAAILSRKIKKKWLVPLPPVLINAFVIGWVLYKVESLPFWMTSLTVGIGQLLACYGLGLPLLFILDRYRDILFKNDGKA